MRYFVSPECVMGPERLSRNVRTKISTVPAQHPSRPTASAIPLRDLTMSIGKDKFYKLTMTQRELSRGPTVTAQHSTLQLSDHTGTHCIAGGHLCCRNWTLHTDSQFSVLATGSCQHLSPHISCLSLHCVGASKLVNICHHLVSFLTYKFYFKQLLVKWHGKFQTISTAAAAAAVAARI